MKLTVNNEIHAIEIDPDTPLLWVLREILGLTGTKYSCGIGSCGACTVHLSGKPVRSCVLPVGEVGEREVITIEGLAGPVGETLKRLWIEEDAPQCGYCQPGQIMTAAGLLNDNPKPSDRDIDAAMSRTLCRCGTYLSIRRAIQRAIEGK